MAGAHGLAELLADGQDGVQGAGGVLEHDPDLAPTQVAQGGAGKAQRRFAANRDAARGDLNLLRISQCVKRRAI